MVNNFPCAAYALTEPVENRTEALNLILHYVSRLLVRAKAGSQVTWLILLHIHIVLAGTPRTAAS